MKKLKDWWEKRKKSVITTGIVVAILIVCWCCYYAGYQQLKGENSTVTKINLLFGSSGDEINVKDENRKENVVTFLIAGQDRFRDFDTLMIGVLDKENLTLRILSIPKNTLANNDKNNKQISKVHSEEGMDGLKKELKNLTGLPIDRYCIIKHEGFEKLVNAVGGITFTVPQQMDYSDPIQDLSIHLTAGEQTLDGENALDFVRYCSYVDGDLGRIRAQQSFLKSFARQVSDQISRPKELAKLAAEVIDTDMSAGELLWLAKTGMKMDVQQNIFLEILPGLNANFLESTYYVVNETAALGMINAKLNPYKKKISALGLSEIGQNLFEGWQWNSDTTSQGFTPDLSEEGLDDPNRFCEYYYEYASDAIEDSLFQDAMDTPDKTKKEESNNRRDERVPVIAVTPNPTPSPLSIPTIQPTPRVENHYIVLDPNQNPLDLGIDPNRVQYWTSSPSPTPTPAPTPEPVPIVPEELPVVELTPEPDAESSE